MRREDSKDGADAEQHRGRESGSREFVSGDEQITRDRILNENPPISAKTTCRALGFDCAQISKVENGKQNLTIREMEIIAKHL